MRQNPQPTWVNRPTVPLPKWVEPHLEGQRLPNGTFMIKSRVGEERVRSRVLNGNVVFLHEGVAYTCPPSERDSAMSSVARADRPAAMPIGPGKNVDRSGCAKRPSRQRRFPPPIGVPPSIEWIPLERLSMDTSYQRSTDNQASERLIASIAFNFDWRLCAPLVVSRRADGLLAVIDGQHRTLAARKRGDIPFLPCCLFTYDSPEEEARMFVAANRARKPMNRLDDFHAALAAADEDALEIQRLVSDAGLSISKNTASTAWKPGEIAFTASISTTIRKHGVAIVSAALTNVAEAFAGQRVLHSGSIFLGLVKILANPPAGLDPDRLFRALQRHSAEDWGGYVKGLKGGDTRAQAVREALLREYERTINDEACAA